MRRCSAVLTITTRGAAALAIRVARGEGVSAAAAFSARLTPLTCLPGFFAAGIACVVSALAANATEDMATVPKAAQTDKVSVAEATRSTLSIKISGLVM